MEGHSLQQPALRYGVSQGSVIAPLLFSIMLYDINKIQKHDAVITLYADDLAIWKEPKCRFTNITKTNSFLRQIQKQFHEIINTVNQYMFHNWFSLSSKKTVFIIFGPWHPVSPEFRIIINGQRLYAAKQVKYLGVTFQWSGSVSKHVHSNIQSALRATNLIKLLSRMPWSNQPKTMITMVKSLVRSLLYYGLEA